MTGGLKIVGLCVIAAVGYGVLHDQITARLCIEYFTIGHRRMHPSDSPTIHGLIWGVRATWWVGVGLGIPLAIAARFGPGRKRAAGQFVRPLGWVLATAAAFAVSGGLIAWWRASAGLDRLSGRLATRVPDAEHVDFLTCLGIHRGSYLGAAIGGLTLILWVLRSRWKIVAREDPIHAVHTTPGS